MYKGKKQSPSIPVDNYLYDLHKKIKEQLINCLSELHLPDDSLHKKALSLTLLGIAGVVADDIRHCDEEKFLELAQAAYKDAQLAIMQTQHPARRTSDYVN